MVWLQKYEGYGARRDRLLQEGLTWFKLESTLFSRVRQNNGLFWGLSSVCSPGSKYDFVVFYREFTKLATGVSFLVLVISAVATVGPGAPSPPNDCLCPPPILVHSECFFGASRKDKTTDNNGKRNNNFQTWFSFEVFSIVCKIAGHQLLYINVTQ